LGAPPALLLFLLLLLLLLLLFLRRVRTLKQPPRFTSIALPNVAMHPNACSPPPHYSPSLLPSPFLTLPTHHAPLLCQAPAGRVHANHEVGERAARGRRRDVLY
jgi:hypothetical protein